MPIKFSPQSWQPGNVVKVGFMSLKILNVIPTPGDYRPDVYHMINPRTMQEYFFTPHYGLEKIEEKGDRAR